MPKPLIQPGDSDRQILPEPSSPVSTSPPSARGRLAKSLGFVVSFVFLWLAARGVEWAELVTAMRTFDPWWVLAAALSSLAQVWLRAGRWSLLLASPPPMGALFRALSIASAANNLLPMRAGDLARAFLLRREGVDPARSMASILVERLFDVGISLGLLALALWLAPLPSWISKAGLSTLIVALIAVGLLGLASRLRRRCLDFLGRFLRPSALGSSLLRAAEAFLEGAATALHSRRLPMLSTSSVGIAFLMVLPVYLCQIAGRLDIPLEAAVVVTVFVSFAIMIPAAPGNLGTLQFACVVALGLYGVPKSSALLFSLVFHVSQWLPITLLGSAFLWREGTAASLFGNEAAHDTSSFPRAESTDES